MSKPERGVLPCAACALSCFNSDSASVRSLGKEFGRSPPFHAAPRVVLLQILMCLLQGLEATPQSHKMPGAKATSPNEWLQQPFWGCSSAPCNLEYHGAQRTCVAALFTPPGCTLPILQRLHEDKAREDDQESSACKAKRSAPIRVILGLYRDNEKETERDAVEGWFCGVHEIVVFSIFLESY